MNESWEEEDTKRVKDIAEHKAVVVHFSVKKREQRKIEVLKNRRINALTSGQQCVENTTTTPIPDYLERTLKLGPNFNVQNNEKIPYVAVVAEIEKAIKYQVAADDIRADVATAIINHINFKKQPRHHEHEWITKDVKKSQRFLKGNKTVVLSANEYKEKMQNLIDDENTYKKLKGDPTTKIIKKIGVIVDAWRDKKYIETKVHRKLKVTSCNPPRIYGLPKIHKQDRPMRPVVSTIGSATYNLAQFLAEILGKVVGKTTFHVRNSFEFAEEITGTQIAEGAVLFSLDVTSLYTNIPIEDAIICINERWNEIGKHTNIDQGSFIAAVRLVLDSTFFVYQGTTYSQCFGVPMGSPLSPVIANLVMEKLEQHCIAELEKKNINLTTYRRYVDDCFY
ncbi:uncharacterized protein LOC128740344 [Sabethes cyaneus]|uniref:uncharacterized protein LOC128740344 n=1 Tax=Sabethes cyaneus TaxID=53552 RepID=UPI00237D8B9E|nr:uncharacterized protein LOC128740344 [Sabethes cyaneus]